MNNGNTKTEDKSKKEEDNQKSKTASSAQEELEKVKNDFNELKAKFDQLSNQLKRAVADYQNLEKRVEQGRSELTNWVGVSIISKLLPILDHFEKALEGTTEAEQKSGWLKGVGMAVAQLKSVLKEEGLEEIVADGEFDPALHEAVDIQPGDDNKILKVTERGYMLNGKVIKPVKVVVGRK